MFESATLIPLEISTLVIREILPNLQTCHLCVYGHQKSNSQCQLAIPVKILSSALHFSLVSQKELARLAEGGDWLS
jgi:hypothetical protein